MRLSDAKLAAGQKLAAAKRRRAGADMDERVKRAIAAGVPVDPYALAAHLRGVSYFAARRALIRLGLWRTRT